jgi:hypothetical protein
LKHFVSREIIKAAMQRILAPGPETLPRGIRFGNFVFEEPVRWGAYSPEYSGIFGILLPDFTWAPKPFQPIFFGEIRGAASAAMTQDEYVSLLRTAAGRELYVASCQMPFAAASQRHDAVRELIRAYNPLCNREPADERSGGLLERVAALEKRTQEQDAAVRVLFAAAARLLEPMPEPRRRTFGFTPAA